MAKGNRPVSSGKATLVSTKAISPKGRSLATAKQGIHTSADFAEMMSGLMTDLRDGSVTPQIGNAICNAGGKLLKVVEMNHKYGRPATQKPLLLSE